MNIQEYYDSLEKQKQLVLQLRGASVTESTIKNEGNKTIKSYNAMRRVLGQPPIPESEPRHDPIDPLTLHSASTYNNNKAASEKVHKTYDLIHMITRA
jgi:hypothetical protein